MLKYLLCKYCTSKRGGKEKENEMKKQLEENNKRIVSEVNRAEFKQKYSLWMQTDKRRYFDILYILIAMHII